MMNDAFDLRLAESHIEVHKFRTGAILAATLLALMLQAFVPTPYAVMLPTAPKLATSITSNTMTSGPTVHGGGGGPSATCSVNPPVAPL